MIKKNQIIAQRYKILSSIGEGGMADVYLAYDQIIQREVAIKILRGELSKDPVTLVRFQREASAITKLSHPNVVNVYDVGEFDSMHYIVMEYVKGRTLKQLISLRGGIYLDESLNIMIQLTKAVLHAHEHGIVHRDIKPQNVLVNNDNTIKITDFGIAFASDAIALTPNESVLGSAHYLAPEATKGEGITHQVDIYALGIVFYELLSGNVPFKGENPVQVAVKHLHDEIPSIKEFRPDLPQSVENIIILATAKDVKNRYQSAKEMLYDLEHCLDQGKKDEAKVVFKKEEKVVEAKPIKKEIKTETKSNKGILIVTSVLAALFIVIIALSLILMDMNKMIVVPQVSSMKQEDVKSALIEAGFESENIKFIYEYSDDLDKGEFIKVSLKEGSEVDKDSKITITYSNGKYYLIQDYTSRKYEDVKTQINKAAPNINIEVEYYQTTSKKSGYIYQQEGIEIGSKVAPNEQVTIKFIVTAPVEFEIYGIVGMKLEDAKAYFESKGIYPVLYRLNKTDEDVEEGVVVDIDPAEGSWYIQEGNNTVTLYYY